MELKQYFYLLRKWAWLIILGMTLGGVAGYLLSIRQPTIYQTKSRIMISRGSDQDNSAYYLWNDIQLAQTYSQLINTQPVITRLVEELQYPVSGSQITVKHISDSLLLEIAVTDSDPERAAEISNTIVEVFADYNEGQQAKRYEESEKSLLDQKISVEEQIKSIQEQMTGAAQQNQELAQQQQAQSLQERLAEIQRMMSQVEDQIIQVEYNLAHFYPEMAPTSTPKFQNAATATPEPTATLSPERFTQLKELEIRRDQLKTLQDLYKQTYASLTVLGDNTSVSDGNTQQRLDNLQTALALYQQIYTNLLNNYEEVRLAKMRSTTKIDLIEPAPIPSKPIQPKPTQDALVGVASGALLMGAIAFLVEYLDDTIKTPEDVNRYLSLPVIGMIGEMGRAKGKKEAGYKVYLAENPLSPISEAFRSLRTNIDFASVDKPIRTLMITSSGPSEGKSNLSVNLAVVIAQGDRKVVLVDADLRRPTIHRYLQVPNRRGLTDVFRDQIKLTNVINSWGDPQIAVVTSGGLPPNPSELLGSEKMEQILTDLKEKSDMVILDTPPCIVADPIVLSAKVDGVVLIVEPGGTKIGAAQVVMEQLQRAGARVIGVVLNPISRRRGQYYSKYHYYSSYYASQGYGRYYFSDNGSKRKRNAKPKESEAKKEKVAD